MKEDLNLVFKFENTIRKNLVRNKTEEEVKKEIGVYEIPCRNCDLKYFGETGRSLEIRTQEHKRDYDNMKMNNVLVKHSWERDHRIDWERTKLIYKSHNVGNRRLVEGAAINLGFSMEGNKAFTQEDEFINKLICKKMLNDFNLRNSNSLCVTPNVVAAPLSPTQVTRGQNVTVVAGAQAVNQEEADEIVGNQRIRRSRRLAGLPMENEGIT